MKKKRKISHLPSLEKRHSDHVDLVGARLHSLGERATSIEDVIEALNNNVNRLTERVSKAENTLANVIERINLTAKAEVDTALRRSLVNPKGFLLQDLHTVRSGIDNLIASVEKVL